MWARPRAWVRSRGRVCFLRAPAWALFGVRRAAGAFFRELARGAVLMNGVRRGLCEPVRGAL